MSDEISVAPVAGGWSVVASFNDGPMIFRSGAKAEEAARRLARAAGKSGRDIELRIYTRDGAVAVKTLYSAEAGQH